jgi:Xaa-Pro aminopeptidase
MILQHEYRQRRQRLVQQLENNSVVIIPAAREVLRNGDAHYRFRQNSDFYYLTGFDEPDAVLLLAVDDHRRFQYILFSHENTQEQLIWHGQRAGQTQARQQFLADEAYPLHQLDEKLPEILADRSWVYLPLGRPHDLERRVEQTLDQLKSEQRSGIHAPDRFIDIQPLVHEMRLFKSDSEIDLMRQAAQLSAKAHIRAMQHVSRLNYEYEVEAELLYEFSRQGCRAPAYDSIVAGGANACILHYTRNQAPLNKGELLLIDAGGEYHYYAADISRTFPINGRFNAEQRAIYELVLEAQLAGLEQVKPGVPWHRVQQRIVEVITHGLIELGILAGPVEKSIADQAYRSVYMHNSGHWLGLDVHDAGDYKIGGQWRPLEAGMVLTVEPGIYISETADVDDKWRGIGVRIEDDVSVTEEGHEILSALAPKTVDDIQAVMQ